ncbi:Homeodomain-like superfamily protein [Forsythia ovata]|uniref:Homeodomain-like superfamily protein n=1 Tax=Forsythia ovata TaxID=205694 RepID=A0ABD1WEJ2_9LAMI
MALEQLSLAPVPVDGEAAGYQHSADGNKVARLPRWTRQEILVLIQGKTVAENRLSRGRASGLVAGSDNFEPKWDTVSSYCISHGANRGPVQCRKRWGSLVGDFKKIKEWESKVRGERESYWLMRNDIRKEEKLPGVFDREVYDILDDGGGGRDEELDGALTAVGTGEVGAEEVEAEALFDSGRSATLDDGLFSDFEQSNQEEAGGSSPPVKAIPTPIPNSEHHQPFCEVYPGQGKDHEKENVSEAEIRGTQERRKRKRYATDRESETADLQHQLLEAVERNGKLLSCQFEAQKTHLQLDREQQKDHVNSLITVLNKLADALGRIADKL